MKDKKRKHQRQRLLSSRAQLAASPVSLAAKREQRQLQERLARESRLVALTELKAGIHVLTQDDQRGVIHSVLPGNQGVLVKLEATKKLKQFSRAVLSCVHSARA